MAVIDNSSAASLHAFVKAHVSPGSTLKTDGWSGYRNIPDLSHDPHVFGPMAAHILLSFSTSLSPASYHMLIHSDQTG